MEELKDELRSMKAEELEWNLFDEVMAIKRNVLDKCGDQSERVVLNALLKLHCMPLSVKILEATMIGKSVNALRNHDSEIVRDIVRMIIKDCKLMVDSWLDAKKKNEEKGGDDDSNKNQIVPTSEQKRPMVIRIKLNVERNLDTKGKTNIIPKGGSNIKERVEGTKRKQHERYLEIAESMQEKPINMNRERKLEISSSIKEKLEATKRKLHAGYKEVENMKKKRRIQVMEFHEVANEGLLCPLAGRRQMKPLTRKPIKRIWSTNGRR